MQAITTKYYGPTNYKGARIRATAGNGHSRATVPYYHELTSEEAHDEAVAALCAKLNWKGTLVRGELSTGYVYVWSNSGNLEVK